MGIHCRKVLWSGGNVSGEYLPDGDRRLSCLVVRSPQIDASDAQILVAVYFIVLQFFIICALALLFSSFSSPLLSAVFTFSLFIIGSFSEDFVDLRR